MPNVLEIDSVRKSFDTTQILTDIYLKCVTGDIVGLLGRNGVGKTTLLKAIFGTLTAEKFVRIDGRVLEKPYLAHDQVCYLPQHSFLPNNLSVERIASLYFDRKHVASFFADDLLGPIRAEKIGYLSGGELRYLEVKLLLDTKCKFALLDEPFSGVSPIVIESLKNLIKLKSKEKGIILTDHDYQNVLNLANKYLLMYDGGIKMVKDKTDLVKWGYLSPRSTGS